MQHSFILQPSNLTYSQGHNKKLSTSPHKLFTKNLSPRIQNQNNPTIFSSLISYDNDVADIQSNCLRKTSSQSSKKILILDDSVLQDFNQDKKQNETLFQKQENKTTKKQKILQPLNPFQQILHQYDTPDFNMTLPFADEFSKIDLKSPTFSDVFNLSQLKSPQINNQQQPKKFFIASKKCQQSLQNQKGKYINQQNYVNDDRQTFDYNQKLDFSKIKKNDALKNNTCFISAIKISKPLQTPKKKSSQRKNSVKNLTPQKIMSQKTYKLKNHYNPSTPKIKNTCFLIEKQNNIKNCQKISCDESIESNPQMQGQLMKPFVSYNEVKNKISPRLRESYYITDNLPTKRSNDSTYKIDSYRQNYSKKSPYKKISIKKLQLQEQLQEIYNGKFKLNRTMRF